jgi:hypothetical protein
MRERGIDLARRRSKRLSASSAAGGFDYVIRLCDRVREACPSSPAARAHQWEHPRSDTRGRQRRGLLPVLGCTATELCTRIGFLIEAFEPTTSQEVTKRE